ELALRARNRRSKVEHARESFEACPRAKREVGPVLGRGRGGWRAQRDPRPYCPQAEGCCGSSEGGTREHDSPLGRVTLTLPTRSTSSSGKRSCRRSTRDGSTRSQLSERARSWAL